MGEPVDPVTGTRRLATNVGFTEGPILREDGVVFVSIDHGYVYGCSFAGELEVIADVGRGVNGAAEGRDGTIYVAQSNLSRTPWLQRNRGRSGGVQAVRPDGRVEWVTQDPIAPNDLCLGPDGMLYVTDPTRFRPKRDDGRLWRVDPRTGDAELLCSVDWFPNGLAFGPEDDALYVAWSMPEDPRIVRMALTADGLGAPETVIRMRDGYPDGFAFDADGNLVVTAMHGHPGRIQTWSIEGRLLDEFLPGDTELFTNVALSPTRTLAITDAAAGAVLLHEDWPVAGLPLHPFRGDPLPSTSESEPQR